MSRDMLVGLLGQSLGKRGYTSLSMTRYDYERATDAINSDRHYATARSPEGHMVHIKIVSPDHVGRDDFVERESFVYSVFFRSESVDDGMAFGGIKDAGDTAKLFRPVGTFRSGGYKVLVTRHCPGSTIEAEMQTGLYESRSLQGRLEDMSLMLDRLGMVHSRSLVHMDIKPGCFYRDADSDNIRIFDFDNSGEMGDRIPMVCRGDDCHFRGTRGYLSRAMLFSEMMMPFIDVEALGSVFLDVIRGRTKGPDSPFINYERFQEEADRLAERWCTRHPEESSRVKDAARIVKRMLGDRPVIKDVAEALYFVNLLR